MSRGRQVCIRVQVYRWKDWRARPATPSGLRQIGPAERPSSSTSLVSQNPSSSPPAPRWLVRCQPHQLYHVCGPRPLVCLSFEWIRPAICPLREASPAFVSNTNAGAYLKGGLCSGISARSPGTSESPFSPSKARRSLADVGWCVAARQEYAAPSVHEERWYWWQPNTKRCQHTSRHSHSEMLCRVSRLHLCLRC